MTESCTCIDHALGARTLSGDITVYLDATMHHHLETLLLRFEYCKFMMRRSLRRDILHKYSIRHQQSGFVFGMSKTRTILYAKFLKCLFCAMKSIRFIFQVTAIDGRFADHEGWYCRKGFPAVDIQVVVDNLMPIRSFTILPGSQNGKSVFKKPGFASRIESICTARSVFSR